MKASKKTLAVVVGSAFVASLATTAVHAAENPFALKTLSSGYMVADGHDKMKDGKCGTGKCGAEKKTEGSCGADKANKAKEGSCHADKAKEGACSADKAKEGACNAEKK